MNLRRLSIVFGFLCFLPGLLQAQEVTLYQADTAWISTSTALVLFTILPGPALFYGGLVQSKNMLSVLMPCFAIAAMVSSIWLFSVLIFTAVVTWDILKIVVATIGLRVGEEEEVEGLDIVLDEERDYDIH